MRIEAKGKKKFVLLPASHVTQKVQTITKTNVSGLTQLGSAAASYDVDGSGTILPQTFTYDGENRPLCITQISNTTSFA